MGEYIDVSLQSSIFPFTLILSSIAIGAYAIFELKLKMMTMILILEVVD